MKCWNVISGIATVAAAMFLVIDTCAEPDARGGGKDGAGKVRIKKLVAAGNQAMVKSPEYQSNVPASGANKRSLWAQISVVYDTSAKWTDELVFQYYVMTKSTEDGKATYGLFKTTVRYIDIEEGRGHMSAVYLRPGTVKRYGDVIAAAVEISQEGKVIAEESEETVKMPPKWWKTESIVERKDVTQRDGYLLERSMTPFAFINIDDYEVVR